MAALTAFSERVSVSGRCLDAGQFSVRPSPLAEPSKFFMLAPSVSH